MLLHKCISREYYRQSLAFYVLIAFVAFGFMTSREHVQLSTVIMAKPGLLIFVGLVWILHVAKTYIFFDKQLRFPENQIFQQVMLRNHFDIWKELILLQVTLNLPFISYAFFMISIGLKNQNWISVGLVILINILLLIPPVYLKVRRLFNFQISSKAIKTSFADKFFNKPFFYFYRFLLDQRVLTLAGVKLLGLALLVGCALLYPTDDYDARLLGICVFLVGLGQTSIGLAYRDFISSRMIFERNMPLKLVNSFAKMIGQSIMLLLPELVILFYHWRNLLSLTTLLEACVYLSFIQVFWLSIQYSAYLSSEKGMSRIFYVAMLHFILIMFKVPLIAFSLLIGGMAWFIYSRNYYTFDPTAQKTE